MELENMPFVSFINVCNATLAQFRCVRKIFQQRLLASSCPSVRMQQLGSALDEFSYLVLYYYEKVRVSLKSDKNNGYLT
jgi:hypothetical protein